MDSLEHLVIDGDQMIFACGFAAEGEPNSHAFHLINQRIEKSLSLCDCSRYTIYIKGQGNFREEVTWDYKATRSGRKPNNYDEIVEFLVNVHEAVKVDGMEADDEVSILLYQDFVRAGGDPAKCEVIVSSPDKDLKNTPGWHLNPMKDTVEFYTEEQSTRHLCFQMLMGDATDNIAGIQQVPESYKEEYGIKSLKVGKKTAEKLLEGLNAEESLKFVGKAYYDSGHQTTHMADQINLLWMARERDTLGEHPCILGTQSHHYKTMLQGYKEATIRSQFVIGDEQYKDMSLLWSKAIMESYTKSLGASPSLVKTLGDYVAKTKS